LIPPTPGDPEGGAPPGSDPDPGEGDGSQERADERAADLGLTDTNDADLVDVVDDETDLPAPAVPGDLAGMEGITFRRYKENAAPGYLGFWEDDGGDCLGFTREDGVYVPFTASD